MKMLQVVGTLFAAPRKTIRMLFLQNRRAEYYLKLFFASRERINWIQMFTPFYIHLHIRTHIVEQSYNTISLRLIPRYPYYTQLLCLASPKTNRLVIGVAVFLNWFHSHLTVQVNCMDGNAKPPLKQNI